MKIISSSKLIRHGAKWLFYGINVCASNGMIKNVALIRSVKMMNGKVWTLHIGPFDMTAQDGHIVLQRCTFQLRFHSNLYYIPHINMNIHYAVLHFSRWPLSIYIFYHLYMQSVNKTKSKFTFSSYQKRFHRFCFLIMVFGEIFPMQQW